MLFTIVVILLVLWALGLLTGTTMGGLIHLLLAVAIVLMLANLLFRRRGRDRGRKNPNQP